MVQLLYLKCLDLILASILLTEFDTLLAACWILVEFIVKHENQGKKR